MAYTYRFASLLSDSDVAELELTNVKFDKRIIVPGSFSGTVVITNSEIANEAKKVIPGKTIVHVYRGPILWCSYIIWSARIRSAGSKVTMELSGSSLESWLYRRIVDVDELTYTQTDQIDILRDLIEQAQIGWFPFEANANLGIAVSPEFTGSGVYRDRKYLKTEAASYGQRIEELANVEDGFEYMIRTYIGDDGTRKRELVWGYPVLNYNTNSFHYFYPGNIQSYELTYDATESATAFWARGDTIESDYTEDAEPLMTQFPVLSGYHFDAAWPHLDMVIDYSSVTQIETLEQYAEYWAVRKSGLVIIPQIEVMADDEGFNPNLVGSYATFTITDPFFPLTENGSPTYSGEFRIVGVEVSPDERGQSERYRFVIENTLDLINMEDNNGDS